MKVILLVLSLAFFAGCSPEANFSSDQGSKLKSLADGESVQVVSNDILDDLPEDTNDDGINGNETETMDDGVGGNGSTPNTRDDGTGGTPGTRDDGMGGIPGRRDGTTGRTPSTRDDGKGDTPSNPGEGEEGEVCRYCVPCVDCERGGYGKGGGKRVAKEKAPCRDKEEIIKEVADGLSTTPGQIEEYEGLQDIAKCEAKGNKINICHHPSDETAKAKTLCVGSASIAGLVENGTRNYLGACPKDKDAEGDEDKAE